MSVIWNKSSSGRLPNDCFRCGYTLAHQQVFQLEVEHALAVFGAESGKIRKAQRHRFAAARKRNTHAVVFTGQVIHVLIHVLTLHEGKREHKLTDRLSECFLPHNQLKPASRAGKREQERIDSLIFQRRLIS